MIRFTWFGIRLFLLMVVAVWLSEHPGKVSIRWLGFLTETSVGALAAILLLTLGAALLGNRLLRDLARIPQRMARHREAQTGRKGRKALTSGLVAVASGDAAAAKRSAVQTEATIVDPVLSHLLNAEALILSGETDAAETQFELLLGRDDTRVIGHRGLIEVALARGDVARAYSRARQARAIMPKSPWLLTLLVDLAAKSGDLGEARAALDQAVRAKVMTGLDASRRQCTVLTALARQAEAAGQQKDALALAETALGHDDGFVPAATLAARLLFSGERPKSAERVLERALARAPHPELIEAWRDIAPVSGIGGDAPAQAAWMARLRAAHPGNVDVSLAWAATAIDARLWNDARRELEALSATPAAGRAYALLGRLEQEEKGNLPAALNWYRQASAQPAPAEPRWICRSCSHPAAEWNELCPACNAFAQLQTPERERGEPAVRLNPASLPGIGTPMAAHRGNSAIAVPIDSSTS